MPLGVVAVVLLLSSGALVGLMLGLVGGGLLSFWSRGLARLYLSGVIVYAAITKTA